MTDDAAYQRALDYLYSFVDYSLTRNFRFTAEEFDLGRMRALLERIGNPQVKYPVLHVAGTKGKGSTAAMIAQSLQASGLRTGFYTSPHLQEYTERIQVDRESISKDDLVALVEELKPAISAIERLTTFEITTALGFLYFARKGCDAAVIEVGLGGRLDATNVVDPLVSVITSLSMDHMSVLGDTLEKIAAEKAGIIKPGRPLVLAPQREEARRVVLAIAKERDAAVTEVGRDVRFEPVSHALSGQTFRYWTGKGGKSIFQTYSIPLLGLHQVQNAATAVAALNTAKLAGLAVTEEGIAAGLAQVIWPCRFELLQTNPTLVIDSAHNRDSALRLAQSLNDYFADCPVILLFGASEDKDITGMFDELLPRIHTVIASQSIHPRAMDAGKLAELARKAGRAAEAVVPIEAALDRALVLAESTGAIVLVAGSLFVAAAVRAAWQDRVMELAQQGAVGLIEERGKG